MLFFTISTECRIVFIGVVVCASLLHNIWNESFAWSYLDSFILGHSLGTERTSRFSMSKAWYWSMSLFLKLSIGVSLCTTGGRFIFILSMLFFFSLLSLATIYAFNFWRNVSYVQEMSSVLDSSVCSKTRQVPVLFPQS
jgi:hypothetical protein